MTMAGFELLVCPMHRFEGNEVPQGVCSGRAHEQGIITQDDGLGRCTSSIVDGIGRLGQRLIL